MEPRLRSRKMWHLAIRWRQGGNRHQQR